VPALHQPLAGDLWLLMAALKPNNGLERIGDLAANISHKAAAFAAEPPMDIPLDIDSIWGRVSGMLREGIDAMVKLHAGPAHDVCRKRSPLTQYAFIRTNHRRLLAVVRKWFRTSAHGSSGPR